MIKGKGETPQNAFYDAWEKHKTYDGDYMESYGVATKHDFVFCPTPEGMRRLEDFLRELDEDAHVLWDYLEESYRGFNPARFVANPRFGQPFELLHPTVTWNPFYHARPDDKMCACFELGGKIKTEYWDEKRYKFRNKITKGKTNYLFIGRTYG